MEYKEYRLDLLLDEFIKYRGASGFATETAECMLRMFTRYCLQFFPDAQTIDQEMLDSWLQYHPYSNNYYISFISILRKFTRYIAFLGEDVFIPDDDYCAKYIPFIPYNFQDEELRQLFNSIDAYVGSTTNKRDKPEQILPVLFRMMYCCGMRPGEPCNLLVEDVNLETGDIYIRNTKKHKDRHIIMSQDLLNLCRKYDALVGSRTYFFEFRGQKLNCHWISERFRVCWKRSGLNQDRIPRPYDLRHAFASRNIMKWVDQKLDVMVLLPFLSSYMGHSTIDSTLYYVHMLPERIRQSAGIDWDQFAQIYGEEALYE